MKVAVYYNNSDIRIEEREIPRIGPGELLVKVWASGICGSDVMEWYRIKKAPRILGHEIAGEIVEVGKNVRQYANGDRVFVSHHVPCNKCNYCKKGYQTLCDTLRSTNFDPGGFAEYLRVPEINVKEGVYRIPDEMGFTEATFIEPLACVVRGQRVAKVQRGDTVLVVGSGISGLLHVQLARSYGASRVIATDINKHRLQTARDLGANDVIDGQEDVAAKVDKITGGRLADKVLICTAALSAIDQAFACVGKAGTVLFFAPTEPEVKIPLPLFDLWNKGVTLKSTYAAVGRDIDESIELLRTHRIQVAEMITHRLSLEDAPLGFQLVANAGKSIKVIIEPHS
jgi:L-iditol 2-dehydrogenase